MKRKAGKGKNKAKNIEDNIFKFNTLTPGKGSWQWWFWLLFLDKPSEVKKPRQLMVLWSTKQDKVIECNNKLLELDLDLAERTNGRKRDGAVAAWYFDGEKMHHNYILKQTPLIFEKNEIKTKNPETSTGEKGDKFWVKLPDMDFKIKYKEKNELTKPEIHKNQFIGRYEYDLVRLNKLDLKGKIGKEKINGSAYFQRVFLNAPAVPWYWGVFHFEDGSLLNYYRPHLGKCLGKIPVKKEIVFYGKGKFHKFKNMNVKEIKKKCPIFSVKGESKEEKISFEVHTYSSSFWRFRKKLFGFGPKTTLTYKEYPAVIKKFKLTDKKTGKILNQDEIGPAVGNAEKTNGFLT